MALIGIVPAAGQAVRMGGIPKMLLPQPTGTLLSRVCQELANGGADRVYVGSNHKNLPLIEDVIPDKHTVYGVQAATMSETVLAARRWVGEHDVVALAMPDTFFTSRWGNVFQLMAERLVKRTDTLAMAAVWKIRPDQVGKLGLVDIGECNEVLAVIDKAKDSPLTEAWGALMWRPGFWDYIKPDHAHVGYALADAVQAGQHVEAIRIEGRYWDCGTKDEYWKLCARFLDGSVT